MNKEPTLAGAILALCGLPFIALAYYLLRLGERLVRGKRVGG